MDRSLNEGMEYSGDPAVGSFFSTDYKRNDDLKQMLDSNRDNLKLEAMKRIIGMIAKGRDASDLFPAVVKNVVSKNAEVKKLVYVYLVRYAEEQQDLALLSISTFQRALKDPNQLIRASALRVLSSIRVTVIVPIVMLAIRDSAADMSPYVRKTAAHAIPKLYSLDPDQKEELVQIIDKLLADRTTLVVGSAVMAFEEVCPERIDLIHKNYRKLCSLLVDVDEWGQVVIVNTLTRYARTQFLDPNIGDITIDGEEKPFYEDEDKDARSEEENLNGEEAAEAKEMRKADTAAAKNKPQMDQDHRLLLKNSRQLLQSRSASVVMAVVQLYHHLAPKTEVHVVIKPLIRLLRFNPEVQAVVLTCIAAMSTNRKSLFEPYMKSFFVRSSDPTQIKLFKLEILTNIANETNISSILREFQTYISSQDKEFVTATIEAIGRCASSLKEVAETCLNGLVSLLSHRDPAVVGGAVVVAKTLLQSQRSGNKAVIAQLAKMVDRVSVAPARAAILWLLGEHCERIPHLPPDVLRKMAKTFADEEDMVKLQIINLAAKLQLTNPSQTTLLCQYILNLAKYDQSYDIRDRARFLRHLLFPDNPESKLHKYAKKILLSSKPAPVLQSKFKDRDHFQLGSLSHFLNTRAVGYQDLPHFPSEAPDPTVRNVEPPPSYSPSKTSKPDSKSSKSTKNRKQGNKKSSFYSDSDKSNKSDSGDDSGSGTADSESDSSSDEDGSSSSSESDSLSAESGSSVEEAKVKPKIKPKTKGSERKVVRYNESSKTRGSESGTASGSSTSDSSSEANSSSASSGSEDSSENEGEKSKKKVGKDPKKVGVAGKGKSQARVEKLKESSNVALLLDLGFDDEAENKGNGDGTGTAAPTSRVEMHSLASLLSPTSASNGAQSNTKVSSPADFIQSASPAFIPQKTCELVNKIVSGGLQISYRFTRAPHLFSTSMVSIELQLQNLSKDNFKDIRIGHKTLPPGMSVHDFPGIGVLEVGRSTLVTLGIDFNDTTQGAKMEILWATEVEPKKQTVTIKAPIGELIRPVTMSESLFIAEQGKLRGMTEHETKAFVNSAFTTDSTGLTALVQKVYETGNLLRVPSTEDDLVRFAGQLLSSRVLVLVSIHLAKSGGGALESRIVVNCEKMVIGSLLLQELKEALK